MRIDKFDINCGLVNDDYSRNKRTLQILYDAGAGEKIYNYSFPLHILQELGAKELASRIYSVFKQHILRPASE